MNIIPNYLEEHYINARLNHFDDEHQQNIDELKGKTQLLLKFPAELKYTKDGIKNLMEKFGHITRLCIPHGQTSLSQYNIAYVEYGTFCEAEKAMRELNDISNSGLQIQVKFARSREKSRQDACEQEHQVSPVEEQQDSTEPDEFSPAIITVQFEEHSHDDIAERVTDFEFQKPKMTEMQEKIVSYLRNLASKSKGEYNSKKNCFTYDSELQNNTLTYFCEVNGCQNEATLRQEYGKKKVRKYFCSQSCYAIFKASKNGSNEVARNRDEQNVEPLKKLDKVCLTAVINENCAYVRPASEDLNYILDQVNKIGRSATAYESIPENDEFVLVKAYDSIYRAVILDVSKEFNEASLPSYFFVQLIDIGNTLKVQHHQLLKMSDECLKPKLIIHKVTLKDVEVEAINQDVINYLVGLLSSKTELVVTSIDGDVVELKDNTNNTNVNKAIVKMACFENVDFQSEETFYTSDERIECKANARLFVLSTAYMKTSGEVVCINERHLKNFYELYKALNAYSKKVNPKSFGISKINGACLVKVNDQWHRGSVIETRGDGKPICYLVDLQVTSKVRVEDIFPLPCALINVPIYSETYNIKNFDATDENRVAAYSELLKENEFVVAERVELNDNDEFVLEFNI